MFKLDTSTMQHVTYIQLILEHEFIVGVLLDKTKQGNNTKQLINILKKLPLLGCAMRGKVPKDLRASSSFRLGEKM